MRQTQLRPARDAPDVVEGRLDVGQHPDGDKHERQHADGAQRAALGVLHKIVNALGRRSFAR